jgi:molecular chaperone IbpA
MAVAGFSQSDIDITLEGNKLTIAGKTTDDVEGGEFLFKGIANRAFTRTFALADKIEVQSAEIVNGMLKVALDKMVEATAVKKIEVKGAKKSKKEFLAEESGE